MSDNEFDYDDGGDLDQNMISMRPAGGGLFTMPSTCAGKYFSEAWGDAVQIEAHKAGTGPVPRWCDITYDERHHKPPPDTARGELKCRMMFDPANPNGRRPEPILRRRGTLRELRQHAKAWLREEQSGEDE